VKPHFGIPDSLLSRKTESKKVTGEAVDQGMKTTFGCSLAAVMGSMLMVGLYNRSTLAVGTGYWEGNPRLELPTISYGTTCGCRFVMQVSLNRRHEWIFDDGEVVGEDLESSLARRASKFEELGYRPALRVRIAAHEKARHFLRLHEAATSAGIENFSIACYRGEVR
jgi:hypothetical protein